jgi:hypothetical protein
MTALTPIIKVEEDKILIIKMIVREAEEGTGEGKVAVIMTVEEVVE